ncbi:MAG: SDR family NAD(P)-dependent oxidoreductase [Actinobacteria bacterium]|nr:SDR family NAD(P)-dependent oxidoreductase [Actinomycetota bacterium]
MDWKGKATVVTGAASGIGRESALAFARRGARVAAVDIDRVKLAEVKSELEAAGTEVYDYIVDVSKAEQVKDLCDDIYRKMGRVDVLYNNAGVGIAGRFEDTSLEDWEWIMGVNVWGVINGCHYFYPRMVEQGGWSHIVNTASGAGLVPLLVMTAYSCTKFAVVGFSETLRSEAALHGIGVSCICPGLVDTPITRAVKLTSRSKRNPTEKMQNKFVRAYQLRNYTPDKVAKAVVKAVEKNKGVVPVCPETYLMDFTHRTSRELWISIMQEGVRTYLNWW